MDVLVTASARFLRTPDGAIWTRNGALNRHFWSRYLDVFDTVRLAVRVSPVEIAPPDAHCASGPGIQVLPLPDYRRLGLVIKLSAIAGIMRAELARGTAVMLRMPDLNGSLMWSLLAAGRPYGAEIVADPMDLMSGRAFRNPLLRPILRRIWVSNLKNVCHKATGVAYVTREALQRGYPPGPGAFTTHYSSIVLRPQDLVETRVTPQGAPRLAIVASLDVDYKGVDTLLEALVRLPDVGLDIVGGGRNLTAFRALADRLGVAGRSVFHGQVSDRGKIKAILDAASIFVLPSRQEGLPRALLEAMARGLPAVATAVGGTPELLEAPELVAVDDPAGLATTIAAILADPVRAATASARNLALAGDYLESGLRGRRIALYRQIEEATRDWRAAGEKPAQTLIFGERGRK